MRSTEGTGTSFTIKIPLTLAIVSALIVGIGEERFAIPQLDVRELVMISPQSASRIEMVNGVPLYRLRDRLLPLIDLRQLLKIDSAPLAEQAVRYITAIRVGAYNYGLIVDKVFDTEEIVVKPVTTLLRHLPVFSGNTILGDGHVIMILDPAGIMNMTGINNVVRPDYAPEDASDQSGMPEIPLLLFESVPGQVDDDKSSKIVNAVSLHHVSRLEEIDLAQVEWSGKGPVIQYRGSLMPIYQWGGQQIPLTGKFPVIVFSAKDGLAGLVVKRIFDITDYRGNLSINANGPIAASAIVHGRATDIVNLDYRESLSAPPPPNPSSDWDPAQRGKPNGHAYAEAWQ